MRFISVRHLVLLALLAGTVGCFGTRNRCCTPAPVPASKPCCPTNGVPIGPPPG